MLKHSSNKMKKVLAILLLVFFVVSVTAATVSAAKQVKKGHATMHVRTGHATKHVRTGHTAVVTGNHHRPHAHYYHGQYYPSCDWVWSPHQQQWVWGC
jgi:flagellar basal body-associated protein FliL